MKHISIRPIRPDDLPAIVEADLRWHQYYDEDFECVTVPDWTLTEEDILDSVRQLATENTAGTRTHTIECLDENGTRRGDGDGEDATPWVCGGFSYEIRDDSYALIFCAVHPDAPLDPAVEAVADFLQNKAKKSSTRKKVRLWLRDREEERLEELLPAWTRAGFVFKLAPDHFGPVDGWAGTWRAPTKRHADQLQD